MAILKRREVKSSSPADVDHVGMIHGGGSQGLTSSYSSQLDDGLRANPYIMRCVDLRASAVASLTPILYDEDGNEVDDKNHPLARLLRRPSPGISFQGMTYQAQMHLALNGNAYLWMIKTIRGVERIHAIPPSAVSAFPSGNLLDPVARWQIVTGTQTIQAEPSDVIHVHGPLKADGYTGISPLDSASQSVDAQTEARIWNTSMMRNGAKPSMTISTPEVMTPTAFQNFKAKLNAMFSGGRNAGKIMVLDGGKTATFDGFNARDMDYSAGITLTAREICLAFGVPPELAGDSANKTYANAQEAHREFAINKIAPVANQYFEALSIPLCMEGDNVARIGYDASQIEGMKSDESALISALTSCDFLTDNETRARLSYDAIPDGDIVLTGMGKVPRSEIVSDPMEMLNDNREDIL